MAYLIDGITALLALVTGWSLVDMFGRRMTNAGALFFGSLILVLISWLMGVGLRQMKFDHNHILLVFRLVTFTALIVRVTWPSFARELGISSRSKYSHRTWRAPGG